MNPPMMMTTDELEFEIRRLQKLNAELLEALEKYVYHWEMFFNSPKVGQPPSIDDLRLAIAKAKGL